MKLNSQGFSLIEIMIVVGIMGILTGMAMPLFNNARETSRANTCVSNLRVLDHSKEQYAFAATVATGSTITSSNVSTYIKNGYSSLSCPSGGTYTIQVLGTDPTCSVGGDHAL